MAIILTEPGSIVAIPSDSPAVTLIDVGGRGPQGVPGPTGSTGAPGPQGAKGDTGDAGPTGAQGAQGSKGDTGAAGPQGAKGDTGDAGPQGIQGNPGATGAMGATGASAYAAAVAGGFVGSEAAWLASLVGPTGATGSTGAAGPGVPVGGTTGQVLAKTSGADYATAWTALPEGRGVTTISFGASPGASDTSLVITGQNGIVSTSTVRAWIQAQDTADHTADEHIAQPIYLTAGAIVVGVGFTIFTTADNALVGSWSIGWEWE